MKLNKSWTTKFFWELVQQTTLTDREKLVISKRLFGFTLKEIGEQLKPLNPENPAKNIDGHLDQERVRQIEAKAVRRLHYKLEVKKINAN